MLGRPTVFVLGAGASVDFGFPDGRRPNEAAEVMESLVVLRPYGSLGPLFAGDGPTTSFAPSLDLTEKLSKRIRVYTEDAAADHDIDRIREVMMDSRQIVFLGFGFHKQNMELLTVSERRGEQKIYATTFSEPEPARATIRDRLVASTKAMSANIETTETTVDCKEFFRQYAMLLAG
jgi:hypothetical protein